jgi:HPt (histidine-containing phosphotransfer) domain-containing protein
LKSKSNGQILDRSAVLGRVGGDRKRLRKLIGLFAGECPKMVTGIEDALKVGDAGGVQRAAHTLKGAVATLGAVAAAQTAKSLEDQGRAGQLTDCTGTLTTLHKELDQFRAALAELGQEELT